MDSHFYDSAQPALANSKQYTAAVKTSSLDSVAKAISSLNDVYHKDPKLATIMEAPTLSVEDKSQIVAELQKHTGGADKEGTVKNFLTTLADYNRLGLLKGVCEKFGDLMSAARGEVELTVTSASVSALSCWIEGGRLEYWRIYTDDGHSSRWTTRPCHASNPQSRNPNTSDKERSSRSPTRYVLPFLPTYPYFFYRPVLLSTSPTITD
jgi:hypothetical protein